MTRFIVCVHGYNFLLGIPATVITLRLCSMEKTKTNIKQKIRNSNAVAKAARKSA